MSTVDALEVAPGVPVSDKGGESLVLGEDEELLSIPLPFFSERFSPLGSPNAMARSACPKLRKSLSETSDDVRDIRKS